MNRRHRGFQVHKSKIRPVEYVCNVGKQRRPALLPIAPCGRRGAHRLMGNHVAGHGKA